jgi:hypothetical protein
MLREFVCPRNDRFFLFALALFKLQEIPESFLSDPTECPGEPGKKDVM